MSRHDFWDELRRRARRCEAIEGVAGDAGLAPISGDPRLSPHVALTVFYNGACPICRYRVGVYQLASAGRSRLVAWCDVARSPWALRRWNVDGDIARGRMHFVDADGRLYPGTAAFARLWRELHGYRWLGWMVSLPGVSLVAECVYRRLAARTLASPGPEQLGRDLRHV